MKTLPGVYSDFNLSDLPPILPEDCPIHEALGLVFGRQMGQVYADPVRHLFPMMEGALRQLVLQNPIFSHHCPIGITVFEDENRPGHVGWYFTVTDPKDILWFSIHKDLVDRHFPAELFPHGRPELPDMSMNEEPYDRITRVRGREEDDDVVWDAYDYDDKFLLTLMHSGLEQLLEHPDRATLIDLVEADGSLTRLTAKYMYLRFGGGPTV